MVKFGVQRERERVTKRLGRLVLALMMCLGLGIPTLANEAITPVIIPSSTIGLAERWHLTEQFSNFVFTYGDDLEMTITNVFDRFIGMMAGDVIYMTHEGAVSFNMDVEIHIGGWLSFDGMMNYDSIIQLAAGEPMLVVGHESHTIVTSSSNSDINNERRYWGIMFRAVDVSGVDLEELQQWQFTDSEETNDIYLSILASIYRGIDGAEGGYWPQRQTIPYHAVTAAVQPEQELTNNDGIGIQIDGVAIAMDVLPFMRDSRTFVPFRAIGEAFGDVDWQQYTGTATVTLPDGSVIAMTIGNYDITVTNADGEQATITNDAAPIIVDGRTMLPVRGLAEAAGFAVIWDQENQNVIITTN